MKTKIIKTGIAARNDLVKGANFIADAVKSTLGPFGQNFFLEKGNKVTNDGVTVAREIEHPNEIVNRGVIALREVCVKTNDEAGDGTTTAITLAQAILKEGIKLLPSEKTFSGQKTPSELIRNIEDERQMVNEKLVEMSSPIASREQLIESARVSVEDKELADLIGGTQWDLGPDGFILAEETAETHSSIERVSGIRIDNGFGTSIIMNNPEKQALEVKDVNVILTNHTLQSLKPLEEIGKQLAKMGKRSLVIVARAFSEDAIRDCMANTQKGFSIFPINAPYTDQNEIMTDLAAVLGGKYINSEVMELSDAQVSDLGFAGNIIAKRYDAIFTGKDDEAAKVRVAKRVEELTKKLSGEVSLFEQKNLKARIAQLANGFAILKVGATSEIERKRLKDKADDAVNAVRAALQEGVVPGAGLAFKTISEGMKEGSILKRPLMAIYEQIMSTAPADFVIESWVKDPVKVLRVALEKACSVAGTFATAGGASAMEKEKPRYVQEAPKAEGEMVE